MPPENEYPLGPIELTAPVAVCQAADGKPPRIEILAYNGGVVPQRFGGVIHDLEGVVLPASIPLLADHRNAVDAVVGQGVPVIRDGRLEVYGTVAQATEAARLILALAREGIALQASIATLPEKYERLAAKTKATINGREIEHDADVYVIRQFRLLECTITPIGADPATVVKIQQSLSLKGSPMPEPVIVPPAAQAVKPPVEPVIVPPAAGALNQSAADVALAQRREAEAAEVERVAAVRRLAADHPTIAAQAIRQAWTPERTELEVMRASRPTLPSIHSPAGQTRPRVLEAAIRLGGAEPEAGLVREYGAETMDAAYPLRRMGLRDLIQACCAMDGVAMPALGAGAAQIAQAGFSTSSLAGILSATANKVMLAAYQAVPSAARQVARKLTANDFKTHTGYRLTGDMTLEKVGQDGELAHGNAGESSFTFSVDTYGKVFGITRQMLKNDDLGAFLELPRALGRGAAIAIEKAFWTLVLANTDTFFGSGNNNYISGATTTLTPVGLAAALTKMRKQVDAQSDPILLLPKFLVVPPELEAAADELYRSAYNVLTGTTDAKSPSANVHMGKYQPVVSPYISATGFHASISTTAWYLFADPADVAAFGIAYLDGVETPIIEDAPLAGDVLGQAWRGYLDFGVCQIDCRGAVKSKGAA